MSACTPYACLVLAEARRELHSCGLLCGRWTKPESSAGTASALWLSHVCSPARKPLNKVGDPWFGSLICTLKAGKCIKQTKSRFNKRDCFC